jgi:hypothetical protein
MIRAACVLLLALVAGCAEHAAQRDTPGQPYTPASEQARTAFYKACVDPSGNVISVTVLQTIRDHEDVVAKGSDWVRGKKFRAQPTPYCAMVRLVFDPNLELPTPPPTRAPTPPAADVDASAPPPPLKAKNVPPHEFDAQGLWMPMPVLPDLVKIAHRGETLVWTGKVCVGVDGIVNQVSILGSIKGADDWIIGAVQNWELRPQARPICTLIRFVFSVGS